MVSTGCGGERLGHEKSLFFLDYTYAGAKGTPALGGCQRLLAARSASGI